MIRVSSVNSRTRVPRPTLPPTLSLSPSGGEGIGTAPGPSEGEGRGHESSGLAVRLGGVTVSMELEGGQLLPRAPGAECGAACLSHCVQGQPHQECRDDARPQMRRAAGPTNVRSYAPEAHDGNQWRAAGIEH